MLFGVKMFSKMLFFVVTVLSAVGMLTMVMGGLGACMMAAMVVMSSLLGGLLKGLVGGAFFRMRWLFMVLGFSRLMPAVVVGVVMGFMGSLLVGSILSAG